MKLTRAEYARIAKRTECVGSCMVCLPECGVHQIRKDAAPPPPPKKPRGKKPKRV